MPEPTTILGLCLTKSFLAGIIGSLVSSSLYDSGKGLPSDFAKLVTGDLRQGKLPANHDLYKLAHRSLRSALEFAHASCAYDIGKKQPFFPAIMQAWTEKRLLDQPLINVSDTPEHDWLDRFGKAIRDDAAFAAFDGTGTGLDEVDATSLTAPELDTKTGSLLNARLSEWVARHVESPAPAVSRPRCFEDGLNPGFPIDGDTTRRLTVYAAWCLFFREGLKDDNDERPFKAYVIAKLEELSAANGTSIDSAAFADGVSEKLIENLGERIPSVDYFDNQFLALGDLVRDATEQQADRVIDAVNAAKPANLIPRLPNLQNQFVGRAEEQQTLLDTLRSGGTGTMSAGRVAGIAAGVRGQGGIGKTALALAVAHQIKDDFPDGRVYIDLRGTTDPLSPRNAMESIVRQFDSKAVFKDTPDDQLTAQYRSFLASKKVLLLLDNAAEAKQVTPLIPGGSCAVIVTSRKQFNLNGVAPLSLDLLSEADAVALAQSLAPRLTDDEARDLAQACGRLALAVRLVATQVSLDEGISVADHLDDLTSDRLAYLDAVETDAPDSPHGHDSLPFARRAIELSLEGLDNPALRPFWARLSVFPLDFDHSLGSLFAFEGDEPDLKVGHKMLEALRRHALLEFDAKNKRYSLHDLAREYAQTRGLDETARFDLAKRHATIFRELLSLADDAYLDGRPVEGLAMLDAEMPSVLAGQAWAAAHCKTDRDAVQLATSYYNAGVYVLSLRLSQWAQIDWLETAASACREIGDRRGEGAALGNLGIAHAVLGDARKAIEYYEQQIIIARDIGDRRGEGSALGNLGIAHKNLGDARKAIEYYEQQIIIARDIGDRRGEGSALGNLGIAHADLGDARKAIEYYEQHLSIARDIGDRRGEGNALGNLGIAHAALGDARKAIEYYEQQIIIARDIGDRRGEGSALGNLGNAHADLGDVRKAIEYYEQALIVSRDIGDRRGEGNALGNLGIAHKNLGDARKAIEHYEQALGVSREIGDRHGEGISLGNLGNAHADLGDARKAIEYYEQQIIIAREIGDRHGEGNAYFNRSDEYATQGQWHDAADDMERAAAIFADIQHPKAAQAAELASEFRQKASG